MQRSSKAASSGLSKTGRKKFQVIIQTSFKSHVTCCRSVLCQHSSYLLCILSSVFTDLLELLRSVKEEKMRCVSAEHFTTLLPREPLKSQHSLLCPLQLTQTVCRTRQRGQHKPRPAWKPLEAGAAQRFDRKPESDAEYQDTSDPSGVFWRWRTFPCWSGL